MPTTAPTPAAPMSIPMPFGPLSRMSPANTGINTVYGVLSRLMSPTSTSSRRMAGVCSA